MLSLCATPIGNLEDITLRVLRTLQEADVIFCEDTRHSLQLLNHFDIKKPLVSCHTHNERMRAEEVVALLKEGKQVCYISDAGMPGISDPGAALVEACIREELPFTVLPGASATLMSLILSGLSTAHFTFYGFLPRSGKERREALSKISGYDHPVILYESPHRVQATLKDLLEAVGDGDCAVLRELTKKFECVRRGKVSELIPQYETEPKGECVILIDPGTVERQEGEADPQAVLIALLQGGASVKEAAAEAAKITGLPKKELYALAVELREKQA